ncbi:MAG TPA: hypothetical protein VM925_02080 [Labilithrix sp.]|nr:hypothetical protein [Labilithrix sp.]
MKKLASLVSAVSLFAFTTVVAPACSTSTEEKEPVAETSQGITKSQLKIVGSLSYGETSAVTAYKFPPRYTAYKFAGSTGDAIDVWVKSPNGDPVAWILDDDFRVVAMNDDASRTDTSSHVQVTLPAHASATHYIVVRDYWLSNMTFKVSLAGKASDPSFGCNVDKDCVRLDKDCCQLGDYVAVLASKADAYKASLKCPDPLYCPMIMVVDDHSVAQCNAQTHRCEVVKPKDIQCGGFTMNPHACPDGYRCRLPQHVADVPGKCVQFCGGIAAFQCTDPNEQCIDDPTDDCDPNKGGADCGGICVPPNADCRTTGCGPTGMCSFCWGSWSCLPQGARC